MTSYPERFWVICTDSQLTGFHISELEYIRLDKILDFKWIDITEVTGRKVKIQTSHISDIRRSTPESRDAGNEYAKYLEDLDPSPSFE